MSGLYVVELVEVLDAAGITVAVADVNAGWETRSRSSGGFPVVPLGVVWHHTASKTTPANDLSYMIDGSPDAPVGNMLLDRDGIVWPVAAGASNCAGKGGPVSFSRGVCPLDQGNTHLWNIEAANNGVGEPWPVEQIDAYFAASNALNAHFGNQPEDVVTHALGAGDGYTSRKIDPATAAAVEGVWFPGSVTSSGTWSLEHIRIEARNRATTQPTPPPEGDDMTEEQAQQLASLFAALVVPHPAFPDPAGNPEPLTAALGALWGQALITNSVLPALAALDARVAALEK